MRHTDVELRCGQIWLPEKYHIAPREIVYLFDDATGEPHVSWCFPGYPERRQWCHENSFRGWLKYRDAKLQP